MELVRLPVMPLLGSLSPRPTLALLSLALLAGMFPACDTVDPYDNPGMLECTEIACAENGLRIEVRMDADDIQEGEYGFEIIADGIEFEGTCDSSASDCELVRSDGTPMSDSPITVWITRASQGFDVELMVVEDMDLLGPDHVEIGVTLGTETSTGEFDPDYDSDEPNGPGCGVCEYATVALDMAVPQGG
jgi:hypothetical protein